MRHRLLPALTSLTSLPSQTFQLHKLIGKGSFLLFELLNLELLSFHDSIACLMEILIGWVGGILILG